MEVALEVGDVYSRTNQTEKEFALYREPVEGTRGQGGRRSAGRGGNRVQQAGYSASNRRIRAEVPPAVAPGRPIRAGAGPLSFAAGGSADRLPDALEVLRGELDRNPQDPGLYEKLAEFLEQNRLNAHQEEVYQRAIEQFQNTSFGTGWYAKLARFYLREKRACGLLRLCRTK